MNKYAIITDSTSDLCQDFRRQYGIDYVQMNISYDDKELPASLDWEIYSPKELYDTMRNGKRIRTTQVPYETFKEKFKSYLEKGEDVLYILCSSALSGSVNIARIVKDELSSEYPNNKIVIVDSLISCLGQGLLVIKASTLREEGKSIDEVQSYLESNKLKVNQVCTVETLDYLKRAGRVKASSAFFGNLFGVKPIIISDVIGQNYAFKKIKGRVASMNYLVEYMKENIIDPENQIIYVVHADSIEDANYLKEHILRTVKCKDVYIDYIGPIVGASVGPGAVAIYFMGKEVTIKGE